MTDTITLAHGAGGRKTATLIHDLFAKHFESPYPTADDAAVLPIESSRIAMTTDGFIVSPWRFPGGNIGKLSICGTVNDLACMGARPRYLTCAFQIEEGFPVEDLDTIAASMAETAAKAGVHLVAGDTKVAGRGQVDHLFIPTTGVGEMMEGVKTSGALAEPGGLPKPGGKSDAGRHRGSAQRIESRRKNFSALRCAYPDCRSGSHRGNSVFLQAGTGKRSLQLQARFQTQISKRKTAGIPRRLFFF